MSSKLKTNKSMAKRIKVTKWNKLIHWKVGKNHLLTNKDDTQKKFKYWKTISEQESKRVANLIPYKLR